MHEIYLSYSKNTTLPLGIGSLHSDSHPFTHFHFDTFTSLLGLFNWHTDSHPFTHFYFDTFTSLTDHQLPFMPIPLQLHLGSEGILPLGSEAILSYTHLQLQHAPIRLDIYHSSSSSSHCLLLTCNQSHHNTYIIPWTTHAYHQMQTIYIQTPNGHLTYRTPIPTYFTQPVSQMTYRQSTDASLCWQLSARLPISDLCTTQFPVLTCTQVYDFRIAQSISIQIAHHQLISLHMHFHT